MELSLEKIGTIILWLLAILGTWSFFKDCIPPAVRLYGDWQARNTARAARNLALSTTVAVWQLSELRDPQRLSIYTFMRTNVMLLLLVLSVTFVSIGLFEPGQQQVASIVGLLIAFYAAKFFLQTLSQMRGVENLDITIELARVRLLELANLYPNDDVLRELQGGFDKAFPRAANLPTDATQLRKLWRRNLILWRVGMR